MISWIVVNLQQFFLQMFVHPGIFFLGSRRLGPSQGGKDGPQQGARRRRRRRRRGHRCRVVECAAEPPRPLVCPLTHPHAPKHGFLNFPWNSPHNDGSLNQGYRLWRVRKLGANGMTDGEEENFGQSSLLFRAAAKFQGVVFHKYHFPRVCTISNPVCASLPPGPHTPVFLLPWLWNHYRSGTHRCSQWPQHRPLPSCLHDTVAGCMLGRLCALEIPSEKVKGRRSRPLAP